MEELRVTNLLGGALAAITGAVVASIFGVFGTLAGAGVMSIFMAVATAGYAHSLAAAHRWIRRTLLRRAGGDTDAGTPGDQPIRWQRVAVTAAVVFAVAMGAVTTVEAAACQPARQPTTIRGEHLGRGGGGATGGANTSNSGYLGHLAVGVGAHHFGTGRGGHDDRASRGRPHHHGSQRHGPHHDHPKHAGSDHPAALTWHGRTAAGSARPVPLERQRGRGRRRGRMTRSGNQGRGLRSVHGLAGRPSARIRVKSTRPCAPPTPWPPGPQRWPPAHWWLVPATS
jgi:hypothetical protein